MTATTHLELDTQRSSSLAAAESNSTTKSRPVSTSHSIEIPKPQPETTSDRATAAFVRRTLCTHDVLLGNGEKGRTTPRPIDEVLPPLTSSNEVDLQLYGIISVIIKESVHTWYSKITPDHIFVNEVLQIIAHCTRALEQRLRHVDLEALLLDELPELFEAHLRSFRMAKAEACSQYSLVSDPRLVYHTLHPHPALSPVPIPSLPLTGLEQRESESAWRQLLIQGVLAVLLPTEDLENACLHTLVAEIFAEMILGNGVSGKACEGWVMWEGITSIAKVLKSDGAKETGSQSDHDEEEQSMTRLERFGLLSSAIHEQPGSTKPMAVRDHRHGTMSASISGFFWAAVQCAFLACTAVRALILNLATSPTLLSRSATSEKSPVEGFIQSTFPQVDPPLSRRPLGIKRPIVSMKLWSCVVQLMELDTRMPWLLGSLSMLHRGLLAGPGKMGDTDSVLDRFMAHIIQRRILNPTSLPVLLRTVRATLFPNNALGPTRLPPSDGEARAIKRHCAASLLSLVPPKLASAYFASQKSEVQLAAIEGTLSCLDDAYLNKHLIFQIIELIVVRLVPELGEQGVRELIEERIG